MMLSLMLAAYLWVPVAAPVTARHDDDEEDDNVEDVERAPKRKARAPKVAPKPPAPPVAPLPEAPTPADVLPALSTVKSGALWGLFGAGFMGLWAAIIPAPLTFFAFVVAGALTGVYLGLVFGVLLAASSGSAYGLFILPFVLVFFTFWSVLYALFYGAALATAEVIAFTLGGVLAVWRDWRRHGHCAARAAE